MGLFLDEKGLWRCGGQLQIKKSQVSSSTTLKSSFHCPCGTKCSNTCVSNGVKESLTVKAKVDTGFERSKPNKELLCSDVPTAGRMKDL